MKKILIIIVLVFFWNNYLLADEPEYSNSLNENIIKHGWKTKHSSSLSSTERSAVEIITLSKRPGKSKLSKRPGKSESERLVN